MVFTCPKCEEIHDDYCLCCGDYVEIARKCPVCGEYHTESHMPYKVCADCVEDGFSFNLGMKYIEDNGLEFEFFINYLHKIHLYRVENGISMVKGLKQDFIDTENDYSQPNDKSRNYEKLKAFCFEDEGHLANYMLEQGKEAVEMLKGA
ncbi:hypothetical protein LJB89_01600 [Tyzzerella sp. OttesenSCG-928-J15]|nr:hypothetical protein [Tyzzerella sp. OttesenSCG-928-J15]